VSYEVVHSLLEVEKESRREIWYAFPPGSTRRRLELKLRLLKNEKEVKDQLGHVLWSLQEAHYNEATG
jgi:hypothetical protein